MASRAAQKETLAGVIHDKRTGAAMRASVDAVRGLEFDDRRVAANVRDAVAAFYDDGVLKALSVAEGPKGSDGLHSDPAGDDAPESTFAENFLKTI